MQKDTLFCRFEANPRSQVASMTGLVVDTEGEVQGDLSTEVGLGAGPCNAVLLPHLGVHVHQDRERLVIRPPLGTRPRGPKGRPWCRAQPDGQCRPGGQTSWPFRELGRHNGMAKDGSGVPKATQQGCASRRSVLPPQPLNRAGHSLRVRCTLAGEGKTPLCVTRAQRSAQALAEFSF